jgi:DNA-binding CsgD family transcriptional regulator
MKQNNIERKTIHELEALSTDFLDPTEPLDKVYESKIRRLVESPFMFNSFHWVTDIANQRLLYVSNIKKILGYEDEEFTLAKSIQVIHEGYRHFVTEYGLMAYRMLTERRYHNLSAVSHYCIQYPMQHSKGHYILVQMDASVIQIDANGNPIANYNRFEVLGRYLNVPIIIRPRVYFRTITANHLEKTAEEAEAELSERVKKSLLNTLGFTEAEQAVLLLSLNYKNIDIAVERDVSINTVKTQNKSILEKAHETLSPSFRDVKAVAEYLRNIEII